MDIKEFDAIASEAGAARLAHSDFAVGRRLGAFGDRAIQDSSGNYDGAWLLLLGIHGEDDELHKVHSVAVCVSTTPYRRTLVDNLYRDPAPFTRWRLSDVSLWSSIVGAAWRWH